jgi:hypothetical protein
MFFLKNARHPVSTGETAGTSALPGPKFRPIRRLLNLDFRPGESNGWDALTLQTHEQRRHGQSCICVVVWAVTEVRHQRPRSEIRQGHGQVVRLAAGGQVDGWLAAMRCGRRPGMERQVDRCGCGGSELGCGGARACPLLAVG